MTDVRDAHFVVFDSVENEITQTRHNDHPGIRLIGSTAPVGRMAERPSMFDKPHYQARCRDGIVLADVVVNSLQIDLRRPSEPDPHAFRCN